MILTEFDPERKAVINPQDFIFPVENMPKVAVTCYSNATFERMVKELDARQIAKTDTANGTKPVYGAIYRGTPVALAMIDVGAAMSAAMLEDLFVMGVEKVVVFGTCGVLEKEIEDCSVIIPDCAVRDEGTSYHYAPPSDEIPVNEKHRELFENLLKELHVHYTVGKTWSTDAFYRETPGKVLHRKQQGCICVDMECSANAAVAQFRGKELVQFFYAADNLDAEKWEARSLANESRLEEKDRIAAIALELAVRI